MYALKAREEIWKREDEEKRARQKRSDEARQGSRQSSSPAAKEAKYAGSFSLQLPPSKGTQSDIAKLVKKQLSKISVKSLSDATSVQIGVSVEGVKVTSLPDQRLIMAHAMSRVVYCTADAKKCLFALVAKNPSGSDGIFCHIFLMPSKEKANQLNENVGKALKVVFVTKTLQRSKKSTPVSSTPTTTPSPAPQQPRARDSAHLSPPTAASSRPLSPQSSGTTPSAPLWPDIGPPVVPAPLWHDIGPPVVPAPLWPDIGPPVVPARPRSADISAMVRAEAQQLEDEVVQLYGRIYDVESRITDDYGDPNTRYALTCQLSGLQHELEAKSSRLSQLHQQLTSGAGPPQRGVAGGGGPRGEGHGTSLEEAGWFHAGIPREIAMEILAQQSEGSFVVRESSSQPGYYALSMKAPDGRIVHYLIQSSPGGYCLQGETVLFPDVMSLIIHHSMERGHLPCTLSLDAANPSYLLGTPGEEEGEEALLDGDYLHIPQYTMLDH